MRLDTIIKLSSLIIIIFFCGCNSNNTSKRDTPNSGTIYISVDQSFKPVIEQEIRMYELSYPNTHIIAAYKSESDCFKDFFKDTLNRVIIVGRGLNTKEEHFMMDSIGYNPACNNIATDAVAIILNKKNSDSLFSLVDLKNQLEGNIKSNKIFVFDGLNATSTVRYIKEKILGNAQFDTSIVKATKNSLEVIEYVSTHENAIGFVGISWIGNPEDSAQLKLLRSVKLGYVRCDVCDGQPYVKPMQENMITRRYPLIRGLYYICKENYNGLGTGFTSFLKFERGQLIFRRSFLGPIMDFNTRKVEINQSLPKN